MPDAARYDSILDSLEIGSPFLFRLPLPESQSRPILLRAVPIGFVRLGDSAALYRDFAHWPPAAPRFDTIPSNQVSQAAERIDILAY